MAKDTKKNKNRKRTWKIILISLGGLIVFACLTVFLTAHHYISKLNYVSGDTTPVVTAGLDIGVADEPENNSGEQISQEQLEEMQNEIDENINDGEIYGEDGVLNVLLIGSDTRAAGQAGLSDVMVLISINKENKEISLISLMRDIYLYIPDYGYNRINAAYAFGGATLLCETVRQNFKVDLEYYVETDFYSFIDIVDALGGVTVEVGEQDIGNINSSIKDINRHLNLNRTDGLLESGGTQNLSGKQALAYARNRSFADGDFTRTEHQREIMSALSSKVFDLSLNEADEFLSAYLPRITTNMPELKILSLLLKLASYKSYDINQLGIPLSGSYAFVNINSMDVLQIDFEENGKAIKNMIYGED
ncbi:MAG: LCP family protein [Clostridiales bacterium]|jgi:LCP family protein required for cell wall assembly|nr:LCP family protein [Clostridiales bacterium]